MSDSDEERSGHFWSDDVDDVRKEVGKVFCEHRFRLLPGETGLNTWMSWVRMRDIVLSYVSYGGKVGVEPDELKSFYAIIIPLAGTGSFKCGAQSFTARVGCAAIASPDYPLKMRFSADAQLLVIRIERVALENALERIIGMKLPGPLKFELPINFALSRPARWYQALMWCRPYLDEPENVPAPEFVSAAELGLMTGLLRAQKHNYTELMDAGELSASARAMFEVAQNMQLNPERGWRVGDFALEASLSVRALQRGFRDHLGTTPSKYLREVRLRRVRDELRAARPGDTTVQAVAGKWHFHNLGRFSVWYRELFGESPAETLAH